MIKKKIVIVFGGSIEIEASDYEEIIEYMGDSFSSKDIEFEVMGYFEKERCNADLHFDIEGSEDALYGNSIGW